MSVDINKLNEERDPRKDTTFVVPPPAPFSEPQSGAFTTPQPFVGVTPPPEAPELPNLTTPITPSTLNSPTIDPSSLSGLPTSDEVVENADFGFKTTLDWMRARQGEYPMPMYADISPTAMSDYSIKPYVDAPYIAPLPAPESGVELPQTDMGASGAVANYNPQENVVDAQGGLGSPQKQEEGGWSIGGLWNGLAAIPNFLNNNGIIKFNPNDREGIPFIQGGALWSGLTGAVQNKDPKKSPLDAFGQGYGQYWQRELPKNQNLQQGIRQLAPTKAKNPLRGQFGDYGSGALGAINYGVDNLLGGNTVRGVIASVRQGKSPLDGIGSALRGTDYSFLNGDGQNSVLGKKETGASFWSRAAGGFLLDAATDINPLNSARRAGLSALRREGARAIARNAIKGADILPLDIARSVARRNATKKVAEELASRPVPKGISGSDMPLPSVRKAEKPAVNVVVSNPSVVPPRRPTASARPSVVDKGTRVQTATERVNPLTVLPDWKRTPVQRAERTLAQTTTPVEQAQRTLNQTNREAELFQTPLQRAEKELGQSADAVQTPVQRAEQFLGKEADTLVPPMQRAEQLLDSKPSPVEELLRQADTPNPSSTTPKPNLEGLAINEPLPISKRPLEPAVSTEPMVRQLGQIVEQVKRGGISDTSAALLKDPAAAPTILKAAEQAGVVRVEAGKIIDSPNMLYHGSSQGRGVVFDFSRQSPGGRNKLGNGVYFSRSQATAKSYANDVITRQLGQGDQLKTFDYYHEFQNYLKDRNLSLNDAQKHFLDNGFAGVEIKKPSKGNGFIPQVVLYKEVAQKKETLTTTKAESPQAVPADARNDSIVPEQLEAALPVIKQLSFVPSTNPSTLYQSLKKLPPEQSIYKETAEYVERSNKELTTLASFLGHYSGSRKQPLNSAQIKALRQQYGSVYDVVGYPIDTKAIDQYLKTGVARIESKPADALLSTPRETQLIQRQNVPETAQKTPRELLDATEKKIDELYQQLDQVEPGDLDLENKLNRKLDRLERQRDELQHDVLFGSDFKKFESIQPDTKQAVTPKGAESVRGVYQAEEVVSEAMARVRYYGNEIAAIKQLIDADSRKLLDLPDLEPQNLHVGSYDRGTAYERVMEKRAEFFGAIDAPNTASSKKVLRSRINEEEWLTGTRFQFDNISDLAGFELNPTRNPFGKGLYFTDDVDLAESMAHAGLADNMPDMLPVGEVGSVIHVAPSVYSTINLRKPVPKGLVMDLYDLAGRYAFVRPNPNGKTLPEYIDAVHASIKIESGVVDEAVSDAFELELNQYLRGKGYDSMIHMDKDTGIRTLVVLDPKAVTEVRRTPTGNGSMMEQALGEFNVANKTGIHESARVAARLKVGYALIEDLSAKLEAAGKKADAAMTTLHKADENAEAIVGQERKALQERKQAERISDADTTYKDFLSDNEHPGCI